MSSRTIITEIEKLLSRNTCSQLAQSSFHSEQDQDFKSLLQGKTSIVISTKIQQIVVITKPNDMMTDDYTKYFHFPFVIY